MHICRDSQGEIIEFARKKETKGSLVGINTTKATILVAVID